MNALRCRRHRTQLQKVTAPAATTRRKTATFTSAIAKKNKIMKPQFATIQLQNTMIPKGSHVIAQADGCVSIPTASPSSYKRWPRSPQQPEEKPQLLRLEKQKRMKRRTRNLLRILEIIDRKAPSGVGSNKPE